MNPNAVKSQKSIKQKLVLAQNIIKQKFAKVYKDRKTKEREVGERLKPVTHKIDELINLKKNENKIQSRPPLGKPSKSMDYSSDENMYDSIGADSDESDDDDDNDSSGMDYESEVWTETDDDPLYANQNRGDVGDDDGVEPLYDDVPAEPENIPDEPEDILVDDNDNDGGDGGGADEQPNNARGEKRRPSSVEAEHSSKLRIHSQSPSGIRDTPKAKAKYFRKYSYSTRPPSLLHTTQPGTSSIPGAEEENRAIKAQRRRQRESKSAIVIKTRRSTPIIVKVRRSTPYVQQRRRTHDINRPLEDETEQALDEEVPIRRRPSSGKRYRLSSRGKTPARKTKQVCFIKRKPAVSENTAAAEPVASTSQGVIPKTKIPRVRLSQNRELLERLRKIHGNVFKTDDEIEFADTDEENNQASPSATKRRNMNKTTPRKRIRNTPRAYVNLTSDEDEDGNISQSDMPIPFRRSARVASRDAIQGDGLESDFIPFKRGASVIYEYFDDPNEICDRLRLLISSKLAGNTSHTQEINSIVQELRELGLIQ